MTMVQTDSEIEEGMDWIVEHVHMLCGLKKMNGVWSIKIVTKWYERSLPHYKHDVFTGPTIAAAVDATITHLLGLRL